MENLKASQVTRFDESAEGGNSNESSQTASSGILRQRALNPIDTEDRTGTMRTGTTAINTPTPTAGRRTKPYKHPKRHLSYWKHLMTPEKPVGQAPTHMQSFKAIVLASWLNILLVFIPVSVSSLVSSIPSHGRDSGVLGDCYSGLFISSRPGTPLSSSVSRNHMSHLPFFRY